MSVIADSSKQVLASSCGGLTLANGQNPYPAVYSFFFPSRMKGESSLAGFNLRKRSSIYCKLKQIHTKKSISSSFLLGSVSLANFPALNSTDRNEWCYGQYTEVSLYCSPAEGCCSFSTKSASAWTLRVSQNNRIIE